MPSRKRALENMWRFQIKTDEHGNVLRFRPRLCARGDKQQPEVDFYSMDIYSPVARMSLFRLFVDLCNLLALNPFQCDVDTAYLNAALQITHYIRHIPGFPLKKGWIYKVKHAMYGLHQSGREWYEELNSWLNTYGWSCCTSEPCLYVFRNGDVFALPLVYVDDIIFRTNNEAWKMSFFSELNDKYASRTKENFIVTLACKWTAHRRVHSSTKPSMPRTCFVDLFLKMHVDADHHWTRILNCEQ